MGFQADVPVDGAGCLAALPVRRRAGIVSTGGIASATHGGVQAPSRSVKQPNCLYAERYPIVLALRVCTALEAGRLLVGDGPCEPFACMRLGKPRHVVPHFNSARSHVDGNSLVELLKWHRGRAVS